MSLLEQHNFSATKYARVDPATVEQPNYAGLNSSALSSDAQTYYAIRINALIVEHDDLDQAVASLFGTVGCDDLVISRMKKRKLHLKDEISYARFRLQVLNEGVA